MDGLYGKVVSNRVDVCVSVDVCWSFLHSALYMDVSSPPSDRNYNSKNNALTHTEEYGKKRVKRDHIGGKIGYGEIHL